MKVTTLTTRHDEICIGSVHLSVSRVDGCNVRIAIDAPREIAVDRKEARERKRNDEGEPRHD